VEPIDPELLNRALAALGERFSMGVILFDGRLDLIWASGATSGVVGWDVSEILGRNVLDLVHPDDIERVMPMLEVALDDPLARLNRSSSVRTAELSVRVTDPGGGWRTVLVAGRVIDLDGNLVVTVRPAEERVAFDRVLQLLGRGERLSMTLDGVLDIVRAHFEQPACIVHSVDGSTVVEGDREALVLDDADELLAALRDRGAPCESIDAIRWVFTVPSAGRNDVVAAMVLKAPWADDPAPYDLAIIERVVGLAALAFERALFDRQLNQAATTDHLTGLLNRRSFERELRSMPVDDGQPVLVLFADLDGLKEINDRHGHAVGDAVLAAVAARLTSAVRSVDVVGRLGGDEFVVACPGLGDARRDDLIARVRSAVEGRVVVDGRDVPVRLSMGVATTADGAELATVIDRSDLEMYRDKRARRHLALTPPV